jgi:hypothetical protein
MNSLLHEQLERFAAHFEVCGDGIIRRLELDWDPQSKCILYLDAADAGANYKRVQVAIECREISAFFWRSDWQGSIECDELFIKAFDNTIYVAVAEDRELFNNASMYSPSTVYMHMLIAARGILVKWDGHTIACDVNVGS